MVPITLTTTDSPKVGKPTEPKLTIGGSTARSITVTGSTEHRHLPPPGITCVHARFLKVDLVSLARGHRIIFLLFLTDISILEMQVIVRLNFQMLLVTSRPYVRIVK